MLLKGDNYDRDDNPNVMTPQKKNAIKNKIKAWVPKNGSGAMYDHDIILKLQKQEGENYTNDQLKVCFDEVYAEYNPPEEE